MTSVESNIQTNKNFNVGVLTPPNKLHTPKLYSDKVAEAQFQELAHDIYQKENSQTFDSKRKTPLSVKIGLLAVAVLSGWYTFKSVMKW